MYIIRNKKLESTYDIDLFFHEASVGDHIARFGYFEKELIQWLKDTYKDTDKIFLDIGAHIGSYSLSLADNFDEVHAFEPNPEVFNHLCANIALKNKSNQIIPHRAALSDIRSVKDYFVRSSDGGGNGVEPVTKNEKTEFFKIDTYQLDSFKFNKEIGLIKIDIEGHEAEMLKGAYDTLEASNFPPIIFESWGQGTHLKYSQEMLLAIRDNTFNILKDYGYTIKKVNGYNEMFIAVQEREYSQEEIIIQGFKKDPIDIWINSPGGCRSNYVADVFEKSKFKVRNNAWHKYGCHWIDPLKSEINIPKLFCYVSDIGLSVTSQLNAGTIDTRNEHFIDFFNEPWSLHRWLINIEQQIDKWSQDKSVFFLNTDFIHDKSVRNRINKAFSTELDFSEYSTKRKSLTYHPSLIQHKDLIQKINMKLSKLPVASPIK